jgi:hypothetical protein
MKHIKNNQKIQLETPYQPMDVKILKKKICEPKVFRLLPNVRAFQKEKKGMDSKFYKKNL